MTQVTVGKLKHGKVPVSQVRDATVRDALMKITENQVQLDTRLRTVEKAVVELQGARK